MAGINRANTNSLWASVLVECLYRKGLRYAVLSPGSRSTPLTVAFAAHSGIEAVPVLDERSAGFFALGLAKQTHQPVVLVCTSGTAAVNYFPAVVEASEARVPLLVLTADRPPELRDCGAGQTIDQIRLYGNYPVFQDEMAIPEASVDALKAMTSLVADAFSRAFKGPVHLNCPFRDPLPPIVDGSVPDDLVLDPEFFADDQSIQIEEGPVSALSISSTRGFILCGTEAPSDPEAYCASVESLSEKSGWPVLADGLSPVRNYAFQSSNLVCHYDLILRNTSLRETLSPECVIALGPMPTSKELRKWLTELDTKIFHVHQTGKNLDPTGRVVQVIDRPVIGIEEQFTFDEVIDQNYCRQWRSSQQKAFEFLKDSLEGAESKQFEGRLAWNLADWLPSNTPVFVASSMPVRDVEYFWPANESRIRVFASRGVNGIDGTLSTSLGIAHGNQPSVLLSGDLAFLHDSNGLLIRPQLKGHLTVILINNHGGGIFNHLPIADFEPPFEDYFATPQDVDFGKLVLSAGCEYLKAESMDQLEGLLRELPDEGLRVIEIETDRRKDSEYRKTIFKLISQRLT